MKIIVITFFEALLFSAQYYSLGFLSPSQPRIYHPFYLLWSQWRRSTLANPTVQVYPSAYFRSFCLFSLCQAHDPLSSVASAKFQNSPPLFQWERRPLTFAMKRLTTLEKGIVRYLSLSGVKLYALSPLHLIFGHVNRM